MTETPPVALTAVRDIKPGHVIWIGDAHLVVDVIRRQHSITDAPVLTIRTDPPHAAFLSLPESSSLWVLQQPPEGSIT